MRVIDCQITSLTFSIEEYSKRYQDIRAELSQAIDEAEHELRGKSYLEAKVIERDFELSPVIKVSIKSKFKKFNPLNSKVCWSYASDNTHFENIFAAIAQGMGYASKLELMSASTETLGQKITA